MRKDTIVGRERSRTTYEELEEVVRNKVQDFIQEILEEEVEEFLGRGRYERSKGRICLSRGYRNGHGKPRKLALMNGTITLKRPRASPAVGFESKVLPLFKRRSKELGEMLPDLYLHGLIIGGL